MKLLALDTSTEACSVALGAGTQTLTRLAIAPRGHAQRLLEMIDQVLAEAGYRLAELDGLVYGRGPGSFTGVRIGASVCQGLAFGAQLPVVGVSSLAALAQGAWREQQQEAVLAAIDARMDEIYACTYQLKAGVMQPTMAEYLGAATGLQVPPGPDYAGAGSAWQLYAEQLAQGLAQAQPQVDAQRLPQARDMLTLAIPEFESGQSIQSEQVLPTYLRNRVAEKQSGL